MKKLVNIISVLAAMIFHCSCISEEIVQDKPASGIRVYSDWAETRTSHQSSNGVTSVSWVEGDKIGLFAENQYNLCYIAENSGSFSDFTASDVSLDAADGDKVFAYYPYEQWTDQDGKSFRLPLTQGQWSSVGMSGYDALYAEEAVSNNELNLKFKHVFSFLKITVPTERLVRDSESGYYVLRLVSNEMLSNIEGNFNIETKELDANCTTDVLYIIDEDITGKSNVTCTVAILPQTGDANISIYAWADNFSVENLLHTIDVPDSGLEAGKVYTLRIKKILPDYVDEYGINHGPGVDIDGVVWAPVNCGYHETDFKYGKLYQWGRKYGQGYNDDNYSDSVIPELRQAQVYLSMGQEDTYENYFFWGNVDWTYERYDLMWNAGSDSAPVKAENDPCPDGWRVPTYEEMYMSAVRINAWSTVEGISGLIISDIPSFFLPAAGYRKWDEPYSSDRGTRCTYWTSEPYENGAILLQMTGNGGNFYYGYRTMGASVRCVKAYSEIIVPVEGITLDNTSISMSVGDDFMLSATISPSNSTHKNAYWYSRNQSVATVDQYGRVTAVSAGRAIITATAGTKVVECEVTVTETMLDYIDYVDEYGINHGEGIKIGKTVWAPVNCGYHAADFKYGKLYQWGRKYGQGYDGNLYDGDWNQTYSDSYVPEIVSGPVSLSTGQSKANEDKFYYDSSYPWDWCSSQDNKLWNSGSESNPLKTEYDPCPEGWRVPTYAELDELNNNYSSWTTNENGQPGYWFSGPNSYTATVPQVFFPAAGNGYYDGGNASNRGVSGRYWSSRPDDAYANFLGFDDSIVGMGNSYRVHGYSVRCVQE